MRGRGVAVAMLFREFDSIKRYNRQQAAPCQAPREPEQKTSRRAEGNHGRHSRGIERPEKRVCQVAQRDKPPSHKRLKAKIIRMAFFVKKQWFSDWAQID
jgi:hypothetical protein